MALSKDRSTVVRNGVDFVDPVAATAVIFAGALVCLDANGNAVPGSTAVGLTARGRAREAVDNSAGADGDETVATDRGVFRWNNSTGADEITRANIGSTAYIVDDETVALTDGSATRSEAGIIRDLDDAGVWIEI